MFVVYYSKNSVIITTQEKEEEFLKKEGYVKDEDGDILGFDRKLVSDPFVFIESSVRV